MTDVLEMLSEMREKILEDKDSFAEGIDNKLDKNIKQYNKHIDELVNYILSRDNAKVVKYMNQYIKKNEQKEIEEEDLND